MDAGSNRTASTAILRAVSALSPAFRAGDAVTSDVGRLDGSRTALAGTGLPATFASSLLGLWYDLGIVGAVGVAVATWAVLREAGPDVGPLLPGFAATLLTVTILGLAGLDGGALWWPVTLATVALMFVAAGRSQFRTRRPRALALGGRRPA